MSAIYRPTGRLAIGGDAAARASPLLRPSIDVPRGASPGAPAFGHGQAGSAQAERHRPPTLDESTWWASAAGRRPAERRPSAPRRLAAADDGGDGSSVAVRLEQFHGRFGEVAGAPARVSRATTSPAPT